MTRSNANADSPSGLVEATAAAGVFSLWLPKSLGGPELDPRGYLSVIEALARADGSVGWCASVASTYSCLAGYLRPDVARPIFGGGRTVIAGAVRPNGKAVIVDGGYRVTGHWSFGSGIRHSTWVLGNCAVHDRDGPRRGPDGTPEVCLALSGDGRRGDQYLARQPNAPAVERGTLYAMPLISLPAFAIAVVPIGIARSAIDAVVALATDKTPHGSRVLLRDRETFQTDVARAETALASARAFLCAAFDELWEEVASGVPASARWRTMARLACVHAAAGSATADCAA